MFWGTRISSLLQEQAHASRAWVCAPRTPPCRRPSGASACARSSWTPSRASAPPSCSAIRRAQHFFGGSFSAGSKPIVASKYAFCSVFQNLQENHPLASKFCKFLQELPKLLQKKKNILGQILQNQKFYKSSRLFCRNLPNLLARI